MKCVQSNAFSLSSLFFPWFSSSAFALDVCVDANYKNPPDLRKLRPNPFKSGMIYERDLWWYKGGDKSPPKSRVTDLVTGTFGYSR